MQQAQPLHGVRLPLHPEPTSLVIVAIGGRDLAWPMPLIARELLAHAHGRPVHLVLHGGARGADQAIASAADQLGWTWAPEANGSRAAGLRGPGHRSRGRAAPLS